MNGYGYSLGWSVEDNIYNALPTEYKQAFGKQFKTIVGHWADSTESQSYVTWDRNMCSPAEAELFGKRTNCVQAEFDALTASAQFNYYRTTSHRKHTNLSDRWWQRSPSDNTNSGQYVCCVNLSGSSVTTITHSYVYGLAPFGCI